MKAFIVFLILVFSYFFIPDISRLLSGFFEYRYAHVIYLITGILIFISFNFGQSASSISKLLERLVSYLTILLLITFFVLWANAYYWRKVTGFELIIFLGFSSLGFFICILIDRIFTPSIEKVKATVTQKSGTQRDARSDIRTIGESFTEILEYDPVPYFKKDGWFFGLGTDGLPIMHKGENLPHLQITGASGFGKSVELASLGYQAILKGETLIHFDPKQGGDEWTAHVLRQAAQNMGVPFYFINLCSPVPQINILQDATIAQKVNLLVRLLNLEKNDSNADYFRTKSRKMARFIAKNYEENMTLRELSCLYGQYIQDQEADGFADDLEELAEVDAINAKQGLSLKEVIEKGHVVYIAGDWEDPKNVMAQRMILARFIQIVSERDNTETPTQVCISLDELSFQNSKIFGDAIKIIRDKCLHFILAHQSLSDLRDVPQNMDAKAFEGAVLTNCPLKFTYRAVDTETAQYFSDLSGKILIDDEARNVETTISLSNRVVGEKQIRQAERNFIDFNMMLSLPKNTGVLFGNGLAKVATVYPVVVEKHADTKMVMHFEEDDTPKKLDSGSTLIFPELS